APERDHLARRDGHDLDPERCVGRPFVDGENLAKGIGGITRHVNPPAAEALELALTGVEGDAYAMIEMRVRDEDVRHADDEVGTAADVEDDVQLADAEHGLVSGARASFQREVRRRQGEEIFVDDIHIQSAPFCRPTLSPASTNS